MTLFYMIVDNRIGGADEKSGSKDFLLSITGS